jgi:hypothetical protein
VCPAAREALTTRTSPARSGSTAGASWPRWAIVACRGPRVRMARVMCGHGLGPWKVVAIPGNGSGYARAAWCIRIRYRPVNF